MRSRAFFLVAALFAVACTDRGEPFASPMQNREVVEDKDRGSFAQAPSQLPEPPPPPPRVSLGGLLPISRTTIERELEPGAGCALDDVPPGPLLVAVAGDAIVNDGGRIVHLKPDAKDLNELLQGGRFVGGGLVIEIEREHQTRQVDEVTSWQATVHVKRGRHGIAGFHQQWSCGA